MGRQIHIGTENILDIMYQGKEDVPEDVAEKVYIIVVLKYRVLEVKDFAQLARYMTALLDYTSETEKIFIVKGLLLGTGVNRDVACMLNSDMIDSDTKVSTIETELFYIDSCDGWWRGAVNTGESWTTVYHRLVKEKAIMNECPNYYAIIPASVRYDSELRPNEKLMYGEITALANSTGECWASNNYFAKLYDVTPQAVSGWVNNLKRKGYIEVDIVYKDNTKEIKNRIIRIVSTKVCEGINKSLIGGKQKFKDNNTRDNNTRDNKYSDVPDYLVESFMEWADMRKKIKKPITSKKTVTRALNVLYGLTDNKDKQVKIIEQSIDKNWLSFYPLKEEKEQHIKYPEFKQEEQYEPVPMTEEQRKNRDKILQEIKNIF